MLTNPRTNLWSWLPPFLGLGLFGLSFVGANLWLTVLMAISLFWCVQAAVHHAEVIALRLGEPFGTLVLALAVTIIEVALIVLLMISGKNSATFLARDSVFSAIMIILNGVIGICLVLGGAKHHEQSFGTRGVSASLATLAALSVLTLILPNYTQSIQGPVYSPLQLGFVAVVSLLLYGVFVFVQTISHREYFLPAGERALDESARVKRPTAQVMWTSLGLLLLALISVIGLAKKLSPTIENLVERAGAPRAVVGVIIAMVVLLPECFAAIRAARLNRLQTSMNLALGSALATIGLTIPAIACVSIATGWTLSMGLDAKESVLLALTLLVSTISLSTGRTMVLQGAVHLVIFAAFIFTTIFP